MRLAIRDTSIPLQRHRAKCTICRHEQADEINDAYVDWIPPSEIAVKFGVPEWSLARHVKALGLDERRRDNRERFLLRIMERVNLDKVTPGDAISAAKLLAQERGDLVERVEHRGVSPGVVNRMLEDVATFWDSFHVEWTPIKRTVGPVI